MLRNARLHAGDRTRRSAAGFVRHVPGAPHRAQVKRWEDGGVALTHGLVRRYEDALELPEGQLLRQIDLFGREESPLMTLPTVMPPPSTDVVREAMPLLERVLTDEPMTGLQWDRLTTLLALTPHVLVRERDWSSLVRRLGLETGLSTGLEYAHRWEASARLIRSPYVTDVVIEIIEHALTDDDEQLYSDYANLLRFCPDHRGYELLERVVTDPANRRTQWASLSTVSTLVRHGLLTHESARAILPVVLEVLADDGVPPRTRKAAASLAVRTDGQLLPARGSRAQRRLRLAPAQRRAVAEVLAWSTIEQEHQDAIYEAAIADLVRDQRADAHDHALTTLVHTALREPHLDVRDTALAVLMLSPQGRTLGRVIAQDLVGALGAGEVARAGADLSMLSWLGQPEDLPLLADVATGRVGSALLSSSAGAAVGNAPQGRGPARDAVDAQLTAYAAERVSARTADPQAPAGNAWGVSYALGMRGRFDVLSDLLASVTPGRHPEWHSSLTWWGAVPGPLRPRAPGPARDAAGPADSARPRRSPVGVP